MTACSELFSTQIYTQVAIRQLQQVHATTHPGAKRRVRGVPVDEGCTPPGQAQQAVEELLQTLNNEVDEDGDYTLVP